MANLRETARKAVGAIRRSGPQKAERKDGSDAPEVPKEVRDVVDASERAIAGMLPIWEQAMAFFNNDQYVFISAATGNVDRAETREGGAKPAWRPRLQGNRLTMQVVSEASLLSSRTPGYQAVAIAGNDPMARNRARLTERALLAVHQALKLEMVCLDTVLHAINTGAGFTMPHWDRTYGEYVGKVEETELYEGEICVPVFHQGEVLWSVGQTFDESRWHCIRKAMDPEKVTEMEGYNGPKELKPDARSGWWERPGGSKQDLVFVYSYFEKPSGKQPKGRWLTFAGGHQIREERPYPRRKGKPVIHKMPWISQPGKHRDLGAGEMLVDLQRMINRIVNQIITWRNLILRPQMMAPKGSNIETPTDEDGIVVEYNLVGGQTPEWREMPEIPQSLFQDLDRCYEMMDHILGMRELPPGVEAASAIEAANTREQSARGMFVRNQASWWASMGQHIAELMQENYSDERLLALQGRYGGVDMIEDFRGNQMGGEDDLATIWVSEASIEPRTKQSMEAKVMLYASNGWIDGNQAMAAINGGTAEALIDDYELDVQRQSREIREIEELARWEPPEAVVRGREFWVASGQDPSLMPLELDMNPPVPFAEDYDDHKVHLHVLKSWMKTREFELLPELCKQAARNHQMQHEMLQMQEMGEMVDKANSLASRRGYDAAQRPPRQPEPGDQNKEPGMKTQLAAP